MGNDLPAGSPAGLSRRQASWFLLFRVVVTSLFLGGTILYQLRGGAGRPLPSPSLLYLVVGVSYGQALVSAVLLQRVRRLKFFIQAQVVWDLLFCVLLIYATGGIDSPFAFLFLLVITSASVFFSRKEILLVASAAAILYGSLLDLQFYGYLPRAGGVVFPQQIDSRDVFYAVFVNALAFLLTAFLSGLLAERLRRSEQALKRREIDYKELESLNRAILGHIPSGLMIVNQAGRIRSFNRAAERITGYALEEAYDREVLELFPGLAVFDGGFRIVERGEGRLRAKDGRMRILGYACSPLQGAQGAPLGLLVTFQDLTRLKEMEEQLKRADKLAAVGRLASGMAHEIRNPLASISGSVQLLMEESHVTNEDRRLMRIVVREADRLSGLLSDFLLFARPAPPKLAETDVSRVLDELASLAGADPRFAGIEIRREYPPAVSLLADREQLRQALWNLAINGAEAMSGGGVLRLGIDPGGGSIYVEDAGPGIPAELRDQIFDPFFTTKDRGTGLGLATVHTIVEAHGGRISVADGDRGGTRFTIRLPEKTGA